LGIKESKVSDSIDSVIKEEVIDQDVNQILKFAIGVTFSLCNPEEKEKPLCTETPGPTSCPGKGGDQH